MEEYTLHDFGEKNHELLKEMYNKFLKYDKEWHFFYEGEYTLLRVNERYMSSVREFLDRCNVKHTHQGRWKEPWTITKKYQSLFKDMFHSFSVLCMLMTEKEFPEILDRVTHCFLNNARTPERTGGKLLWEPMTLHEIATNRAAFIGRIIEQNTSSKWEGD